MYLYYFQNSILYYHLQADVEKATIICAERIETDRTPAHLEKEIQQLVQHIQTEETRFVCFVMRHAYLLTAKLSYVAINANFSACSTFLLFFKMFFVGQLIAPILDFMWPSPWVLKCMWVRVRSHRIKTQKSIVAVHLNDLLMVTRVTYMNDFQVNLYIEKCSEPWLRLECEGSYVIYRVTLQVSKAGWFSQTLTCTLACTWWT